MGLKFYIAVLLVGYTSAAERSVDSKSLNSPSPNLAYTSPTPYSAPSHQGYSNGYHQHSGSESRNNRGYSDDDRRQYYDNKGPSYSSKDYDSPATPQAKVNSPTNKSPSPIAYAGHHAVPLSFASLSPNSNGFYAASPLQGSVLSYPQTFLAYPQPTIYTSGSHGTQFAYVAQPSSHEGHIAVAPAPSLLHSPTLSHFTYASPLSIAHLPKAIPLNNVAPTLHTHH